MAHGRVSHTAAGAAALLVLSLAAPPPAAAQARGNHTALARTFPYGDGSLSADGRYMCFTTSAKAFSNTVCILPTLDSSSYCTGSIGTYYCSTQYSYSSNPSMSTNGKCYESPGAAYVDTPCLWNDIRMDYSQTNACAGTYSGLYVYYWCVARATAPLAVLHVPAA